jgi:gas vesicle protein
MFRLLLAVTTILCALVPASAATEQQALDALLDAIRAGSARAQRAKAVEQLELESSLQVAAEERDLNMLFVRKGLSADIATATALLVASDAEPAEARQQYHQTVSQAVSDYQQALYRIQSEWANAWSTLSNRIRQDANDVLQEIAQEMSRIQNSLSRAILGDNTDMPPVIEASLPELSAEAGPIVDVIAELKETAEEARARYRTDVEAAEATCDEALNAALGLKPGAEMGSAMRKAIAQLKVTCLDRHDQYAMEVRSAARHVLLEVEE